MRASGRALLTFAAIVMLAACNPLLVDPQTTDELDRSAARYANGPDGVWLEVAVGGAAAYTVFALTTVTPANLHGPTTRDCMQNQVVVGCASDLVGVHVPSQVVVPGDASKYEPLMTLWPNETVDVALVCDDGTGQLGCPDTVRLALRTRDGAGHIAGDLVPVPLA